MMTIAEKYKEEGHALGICERVYNALGRDTTRRELIEQWLAELEFCLQKGWPSAERVKEDFGDLIHDYNVFVDEKVQVDNAENVVLNGKCEALLRYGNHTGRVFARHNSELTVEVSGIGRAFISIYDDANVKVKAGSYAKAFVYRHGRGKVESEGNVIVRERAE